jgi:transcriptional regulator with XRE-family HTH domain
MSCNTSSMNIGQQQLSRELSARQLSTEEWESAVGTQFRALRLAAGLDQAGLAERADISIGALRNLERGSGSTLRTLIRVARSLDREAWLQGIAPLPTVSPIEVLRSTKTPRSRVYRPRGKSN